MHSDRRGNRQKSPLTKPSRQNPSDKNPREQLRREFVQRAFVRVFILGLLKIGGSDMCDVPLESPETHKV